jgi:hypothetical protein
MKNAEASQLMDIAKMAELVKPTAPPPAPPPPLRHELPPSFVASRLTTHATLRPLAAPTRDTRAPLYWMIGALNVMVLALAAYVVLDQPSVVVQVPVAEEEPIEAVAVAPEIEQPAIEIPGAPEVEPEPVVEAPKKVETPKKVATQQRRTQSRPMAKQPTVEPKQPAVTPSKELPFRRAAIAAARSPPPKLRAPARADPSRICRRR